jgi:two-component system response regulator HydG
MSLDANNNPPRSISKEDLEAILDSLVEGLVTVDDRGRVMGINRAACEILEVEKYDALEADCATLLGESFCRAAAVIREAIEDNRPVHDVEIQARTRSGREKVLLFRTNVLRDPVGRPRGSVVLLRDVTELHALKEDLARRYRLHNLVGKSKPMQEIFQLIEEVADADATVLIEGESGTGKELVARAIHHQSPRALGPFVAVNCSALAEGVLESELFGHVQGAFTGAVRDKRGRFETAHGGTIFLDEIGDLAPGIQVKLLRVLQERTIERVGGDETVPVDIRVIAATNRNMADLVAEGRFRQDLYYRLRVVPIRLPSLRDRRADVPLLAQHFVDKFRQETGRPIDGLSPEAMTLLLDYAWPGNVRELENAIEYAFVKARGGLLQPNHLPPELRPADDAIVKIVAALGDNFEDQFRASPELIRQVLDAAGWNVAKAARRLQVSRTTLYKRIRHLGLKRPKD